jgi:hypothetical protein
MSHNLPEFVLFEGLFKCLDYLTKLSSKVWLDSLILFKGRAELS